MKNKKKKLFLGFASVLSISILFGIYFGGTSQSKIAAAPLEPDYKMLIDAPSINKVSAGPANTEISGNYGFMFKLTDNVKYEPIGNPKIIDGYTGSPTKVYQFHKDDAAAQGDYGVWIRNAGLFNGRSVDVKLLIDSMNVSQNIMNSGDQYPLFQFFAVDMKDREKTTSAATTPNGSDAPWSDLYFMTGSGEWDHSQYYNRGDNVDFHYEFYYSDTKQKLKLNGSWNFNNINIFKKTSISFKESDFKNYYVMNDSFISYKVANEILEMSSDSLEINNPLGRVTELFSKEQFPISMSFHGEDSYPDGNMALMYSTESLTRIAPAQPIVFGQRNSAIHSDSDYRALNYSILQGVADNRLENRNDNVVIETEVPEFYDITDVKVLEYGTTIDKTNLFTQEKEGSKLTLTSINSKSDAFNGSLFDIQITAKPNSKFKFNLTDYGYVNDASNVDDNGYMLFEMGGPKTKTTYTYQGLAKPTNSLESKVVKNQSMSQVLYEGVPDGEARTDVKIPVGGSIIGAFPEAKDLLVSYDVDTENPIDRPVDVSYVGTPPDISTKQPGDTVEVPLILTSAKGVTTEKVVTITIKDISTSLTIKFVGESNNELHTPVSLDGNTTDKVNLSTNTTVQKIVSDLVLKGYTQLAWDNPFPENDTPYNVGTVTYKFQGNLVLDSVPKTLDFGNLTYDAKDKRVENPTFAEKLVISDTRANPKQGWHLTAELAASMKNDDGKELVNALRYVDKGTETILDSNAQVVYANNEGKDGKFVVSDKWGKTQGTDGIKLQINSSDTVYTGAYVGRITWKIMAGQP